MLRKLRTMVVFFRRLIEAQQTPGGRFIRKSIYGVFPFIFCERDRTTVNFLSISFSDDSCNLCQYFCKLRTFPQNYIFC